LFENSSFYSFKDIIFRNITTNNKSVFVSEYANLKIEDCVFQDFRSTGDEGNSGLIILNGNGNLGEVQLNNITIKNIQCNGPAIKIVGLNSKVHMSNINARDSNIYGSFIYIKNKLTNSQVYYFI